MYIYSCKSHKRRISSNSSFIYLMPKKIYNVYVFVYILSFFFYFDDIYDICNLNNYAHTHLLKLKGVRCINS